MPGDFGRVVKIPFRRVVTSVSASASFTANELSLDATGLGERASGIALFYQKYRVVNLRVAMRGGFTCSSIENTTFQVNSAHYMIGYDNQPSSVTGGMSSVLHMSQLPYFAIGSTNKDAEIHVPRKYLQRAQVNWFDTSSLGTPDDEFRIQGTIYYVWQWGFNPDLTNNANVFVVVEGEVEFALPVDSSDSVAIARRLLGHLSSTDSTNPRPMGKAEEEEEKKGEVFNSSCGVVRADAKTAAAGDGQPQRRESGAGDGGWEDVQELISQLKRYLPTSS